jgi:tripartite-type tricarboxylate transporter receptor subunit TctC
MRRSFRFVFTVILFFTVLPIWGQSTEYPSQAVRVVVPFPAGGGTDAAGRQIAQRLATEVKGEFIVVNQAGAGGNIGALSVAKAPADGYTLLVGTVGTQIVNKVLFPAVDFDPEQDLVPVGWFSSVPNVLVVNAGSPYRSVEDLISAAKSKPKGLTYGSGGTGSSLHLAVELLKEMAGMQAIHVPYKGSAPAITDLIGGQFDFMIDNLTSAKPHIVSGRLRALAVTTKTRLKALPEVPALAETPGLASYEAVGWTGLLAPRNTSSQILKRLSDAMSSKAGEDQIRSKVEATGAEYVGLGSKEFGEFLKQEKQRWMPIAQKIQKP